MRLVTAFSVLICTALLGAAAPGQSKSDRERDELVGPVRSVHLVLVELSAIDGKQVEIKRRPHQRVTYIERGSEVERVNFNEDGSIQNRCTALYNSDGRKTGWREDGDANGDGSAARRVSTWDYDAKGNLAEVRVSNGDLLELRMVYTYDDHGRRTQESRFADGGAYHQRSVYAYNAAGQVTEAAYYFNEVLDGKSLKVYDDAGHLVKETSVNIHHPESGSTTDYVYDSRGREIEKRTDGEILWCKVQTSYDGNGRVAQRETFMAYKRPDVSLSHAPEPGKVLFCYDARGHVIEEAFYGPDQALVYKTVSTYNAAGVLTERVYVRRDSFGGNVSYEYDTNGNWVKTTTSSQDERGRPSIYVESRTITYYRAVRAATGSR